MTSGFSDVRDGRCLTDRRCACQSLLGCQLYLEEFVLTIVVAECLSQIDQVFSVLSLLASVAMAVNCCLC